jgi:hypothetical protein
VIDFPKCQWYHETLDLFLELGKQYVELMIKLEHRYRRPVLLRKRRAQGLGLIFALIRLFSDV